MNIPEPICIQVWSQQGLTPERKGQYDAILADDREVYVEDLKSTEELQEAIRPMWNLLGLGDPREAPEKISGGIDPWKNHLASIERIRALASELKTFCDFPLHTGKVRTILKEEGVITAANMPGRPRKRRRKK